MKEIVKLPAVDRIYTIAEGRGIVGALCGGQPSMALAAQEPASPSLLCNSFGTVFINDLDGLKEGMYTSVLAGPITQNSLRVHQSL